MVEQEFASFRDSVQLNLQLSHFLLVLFLWRSRSWWRLDNDLELPSTWY
jgi:hypothetical protein